MSDENKPVKMFVANPLRASVFVKENEKDGKKFESKSITISRAYTKDDGKTFEYTNSLRTQDIAKAIILLQEVQKYFVLKEE